MWAWERIWQSRAPARPGRSAWGPMIPAMSSEEWEWTGWSMERIMGAPGSSASGASLPTDPPSPLLRRPLAGPLEDGGGRRRRMDDVRGAGDEIVDESEAVRLRGAVRAHLRILHLYRFLRCWDTASDEARAALLDLVAAAIIPLYGDGRPIATALANAPPTTFYALSTPGMPFDSGGIEHVFNNHLRPYRNAHIMVQSVWGMTVAEELLTFDGMCEKNGIDPCDGLDRLMACPE